jgi:hypothetical protein
LIWVFRLGRFLHRQIGFNVVMSGHWTLMTKLKGDDTDIDAGLQQMHCRGVANRMWRDTLLRQAGMLWQV